MNDNTRSLFLLFLLFSFNSFAQTPPSLSKNKFAHYIQFFNSVDDEPIKNAIPNNQCWDWMQQNIPFFECPDEDIEQIYYYRWWVYRKHIKQTPMGFVITEFLPEVGHAKKYNTIACASGLHVDEGKWLHNRKYIEDYLRFWLSGQADSHHYSDWFALSTYEYCAAIGDFSLAEELLPHLVEHYKKWEQLKLHESGLFWSHDGNDGGEHSISKGGLRPTRNSYMYAEAISISRIAKRFGKEELEREFSAKAKKLKELVQTKLWNQSNQFFYNIPLDKREEAVKSWNHDDIDSSRFVKELYGLFPWRFELPDNGFEKAWEQILDKEGFYATYGPTTAEQRHPLFMKKRVKRCQWDGSSWPFSTSIALGSMRNLLKQYKQDVITKNDFLHFMQVYARSQHRKLPYGEEIPWIGESLHPKTGIWLSRAIALDMNIPMVASQYWKNKNSAVVRGKDYNHSSYCDLVISGLAGLKINDDSSIEIDPLIPSDKWEWFCLDKIKFRDKILTVVYDKTGSKYQVKPGLNLYVDGILVAHTNELEKLTYQPQNTFSQLEQNRFKVFPNPAKDKLQLQVPSTDFRKLYFSLTNSSGKVILKKKLDTSHQASLHTIHLKSNINSGIYCYQVGSKKQILHQGKVCIK
ncbi:T9SS type A sorting domain-containing protein [Prolixibacteraceae bacterium JC049]|nr:T9SS type A sorting domain-containing protein [Prolixibacteraceae bacterium JC049]